MSRRKKPRESQAPPFGTSPGLSGYCLTNNHREKCPYPACTCRCHEEPAA